MGKSRVSIDSDMRFALFASGEGSNVCALLEHDKNSLIKLVVCDKEDAAVVKKVQAYGVQVALITCEKGESRSSHEAKILTLLKVNQINWILLAGYLRILSNDFISTYYDSDLNQNRIINIHPSLLPAYPGLRAYKRAFNDGVKESGVSVHFVTSGVDEGTIIAQESFLRLAEDSLDDFVSRGKEIEHSLYCQVFDQIVQTGLHIHSKVHSEKA